MQNKSEVKKAQVVHPSDTLLSASTDVRTRVMVYVGSAFLVIIILFTLMSVRGVQNQTLAERQLVPVSALEVAQVSRPEKIQASSVPAPIPTSANAAGQLQWGPPILLATTKMNPVASTFEPLVKEAQTNLLVLGFDLGKADGFKGLRTKQALGEFAALYLPESSKPLTDAYLATVIGSYARLARTDGVRFDVDRGVVAAIRLSSVRTGVDFAYLMKLAAAESNFKPAIKAQSSSATGLYQFTRDTWLNTVKAHGTKYGLGHYVAAIEHYMTRSGFQRPMVRDREIKQHLLNLRKNPRVSAMMAAELVRDNQRKLIYSMNRTPSQTDLYLTHFLGADGAIAFLKALDETPNIHALKMFPAAARSNQDIFHPKAAGPRTVDEVYTLFGSKFSTTRYDDLALN